LNFNSLTYKQKNKYLLIGAAIFAVVAYMASIKNTVQLYQDNSKLEKKIIRAETAPMGVAELRKSLEALNNKLNHYLIDTTREHEHTLEIVSEFCHKKKLLVRELPQRTISAEKDFTIVTSVMKIEGTYTPLLQLLYELEYSQKLGRLSSVSWKSYVDTKTKRTILYMTVYLQNIAVNEKQNDEKEI
jgi:hypothetical protein